MSENNSKYYKNRKCVFHAKFHVDTSENGRRQLRGGVRSREPESGSGSIQSRRVVPRLCARTGAVRRGVRHRDSRSRALPSKSFRSKKPAILANIDKPQSPTNDGALCIHMEMLAKLRDTEQDSHELLKKDLARSSK